MSHTEFGEKAWALLIKIMVPITLMWIGWTANGIISNQQQIAVLKAKSMTVEQGHELERRIDVRYAKLEQKIAAIETNVAVIRQIVENDR